MGDVCAGSSTQAIIRRCRLPADQVLWLMLGMALFRDEPVHEVARRLNICAQGLAFHHLLARIGVTEARKGLGADPIDWLFRKTGTQCGAERYDGDTWHDPQVFAVDEVLFRTPDTPEPREHFGSGNTPSDRQTPFPILRLEMMMVKNNVRSTCPNLFNYVRYNRELTRSGLDELGLEDVEPGKISQLDSVANIPDIRRVGASYAARSISLSHFKGFV